MLGVPALIVGGGISGLVCAHALRKAAVEAHVLEASARAGGVIRSERRDSYLLELGPQSFSGTAALRTLCNELSIDTELVEAPRRTPRYVLVQGALQAVPLSPPALLASSLLSAGTKARLARDMFGRSEPPEQDESVAGFVRRKFSEELLDRLVGPFVSGIFAGDPEKLSLRSAFPQMYEAEKSAGSVIRGIMKQMKARQGSAQRPTLLSFRAGNETLVRALAGKLGAALRLGWEAKRVDAQGEGQSRIFEVRVRRSGQDETICAEHVILATPTDVAGRLLGGIESALESVLAGIEYAPVAIVSLGYRRSDVGHSLEGFGFLVPRSAGLNVLGTLWNSSLFPARAPDGKVLLTSFIGGATNPQIVAQNAEKLADLVHGEIRSLLAIRQTPTFVHVEKYQRALPQYNRGHAVRLETIERLRQGVPHLWLIGNYLRGPSIGACVEQAQAVATEVLARVRG
jgi:protoporphyrinogen/coproporphyrinogen III oxidase